MAKKQKVNNIVTVKSFKHVLDWFDIKDVQINIDDFYCFEIQERLGNWYLQHFILEDNRRKAVYQHDFQLSEPWVAVAVLGKKIKAFNSLHGSVKFTEELSSLLCRADKYKLTNEI